MATIACCILDCADKTNLSRFLADAPCLESAVNDRRIRYLLQQTKPRSSGLADLRVVGSAPWPWR